MPSFRFARLSWFVSATMLFTSAAHADSASKLMITNNPDGTFTIQKEPPKDATGDYKGLVIPPQVVMPFVRLPEKKQSPRAQQKHP
jgi:hypothetical protein